MSEMSAAEAAIVARFDAAEPAPESWRGDDGLREAIVDALWSDDDWTPDPTLPDWDFWGHYADRVLTLPELAALRAKAAAADRVPHCDRCLHVKAGPHQTVDAEAEWAALDGSAPC